VLCGLAGRRGKRGRQRPRQAIRGGDERQRERRTILCRTRKPAAASDSARGARPRAAPLDRPWPAVVGHLAHHPTLSVAADVDPGQVASWEHPAYAPANEPIGSGCMGDRGRAGDRPGDRRAAGRERSKGAPHGQARALAGRGRGGDRLPGRCRQAHGCRRARPLGRRGRGQARDRAVGQPRRRGRQRGAGGSDAAHRRSGPRHRRRPDEPARDDVHVPGRGAGDGGPGAAHRDKLGAGEVRRRRLLGVLRQQGRRPGPRARRRARAGAPQDHRQCHLPGLGRHRHERAGDRRHGPRAGRDERRGEARRDRSVSPGKVPGARGGRALRRLRRWPRRRRDHRAGAEPVRRLHRVRGVRPGRCP
jgi:hypothetical protein